MSRVPRIRFKGFEEDWEQRKLVNLCEKFTDGDWIEAKDQSHSGVRLIQTGNVGLGEYIDKPDNKKWISEETFVLLNCEEVLAGDILISRLPEPAGRACIVPSLGTKIIAAVDCTIVRVATKINPKYLLQYLSSQSYFDEVNTCLAGGTRQRISRSNLADFDIPIPAKYEEQKAIGEFLFCIDHLITLHQRKLEKLKIIKKSMLENLFPQSGEKTPKIRFLGFTKDWEQRKLGEMVEFYNGDRSSRYPNDSDMVFEGIPFINAGDLVLGRVKLDTANKITEEKYNQLSGAKIQCGDIIYCLRGTLGKNAFVDNFDIGTIASSLVDIRPQKIVGKYLFQVLNSDIEYSQRILNDEGAAQPNLSAKNLYLFDIPIPRDVEQIKIAEYLESLDHLITLHQSKLEKLQKIKKSMLESMFV